MNILSKTLLVIFTSLFFIISSVGWYNFKSQTDAIDEMRAMQKLYIINQLTKVEEDKILSNKKLISKLSETLNETLSNALYNMDNETIRVNITRFLFNDNIVAIEVFDSISNKVNTLEYKYNDDVEYLMNLPQELTSLQSLKYKMVVDEEEIGYIKVYFDTSIIVSRIEKEKEQQLKLFYKQSLKTKEKIKATLINQIYALVFSLFLLIIILYISLNKFINQPLIKFQRGLNSFFDYIKDSQTEIKVINIDTNDEFGEMTKSINESIQVSIEMHKSIYDLNTNLETKIEARTRDLEASKKEIEAIHKHTREAIEYASLIQGAVVSKSDEMTPFFKDHFVTWTPKDIVGGDIWLFNEMRHKDEVLLFFIDCTGHGVPGAFVTMIVKAIEREIVAKIKKHPEFDISPAKIMGYFNRNMKILLKQETKDSISNAGWDGGIIYYNRRTQILKFAGAETPLFYIDENQEFQTIKGNRYSVGYKKCAMDYEYKETILEVKEGMKFYCTTDGYLDQNGGAKDFPFGKKRFGNIIKENHTETMAELQTIFMTEMMEWESFIEDNDRNDDMTVIAFEIGEIDND